MSINAFLFWFFMVVLVLGASLILGGILKYLKETWNVLEPELEFEFEPGRDYWILSRPGFGAVTMRCGKCEYISTYHYQKSTNEEVVLPHRDCFKCGSRDTEIVRVA